VSIGTDPLSDTFTDVAPSVSTVDATVPSAGSARRPGGLRGPSLWFVRLGVLAVAIGVWWLATQRLWSSNQILVRLGPADAFAALGDMIGSGDAWRDTVTSLQRLGLGLAIATSLGAPLGLLLGSSTSTERATSPLVQFLRMLSPLAWAPAAVAVFGIGSAPVTFLVVAATIWPIALGVASGVRALDPGWSTMARSLGATRAEVIRTVVVPGVRPPLLTSLRLALGVGWVVLVPAEMLGVDSGLGYAVLNARDQLAYDRLAATMLLIGIVGFLLDGAFQWALRPRRRTS
jgi:NitT/TauT family transport system permease protein